MDDARRIAARKHFLEIGPQLLRRLEAPIGIDVFGAGAIERARDVACHGIERLGLTAVTRARARIDQGLVLRLQVREHVFRGDELAQLAALGLLCITRAYSRGATLVVACLQYFGIVFGAIYSVTLFGDRIPPLGWAGMALIVASGVGATILRARAAPDAPAEEH